MAIARWYEHNFSNEQVVQGKKTIFLRFKNTNSSRNLWILPIVEKLDQSDGGTVYFNGYEIQPLEDTFKFANNYQDHPYLWYGGPINGSSANDYHQFLPKVGTEYNKLFNDTSSFFSAKWIEAPVNPKEKHNFRIDYEGDEAAAVKITFLLTTINPSNASNLFEDSLPEIRTTTNTYTDGDTLDPADSYEWGDVILDHNGDWFYQDYDDRAIQIVSSEGNPVYGIKHLHEKGIFYDGEEASSGQAWTGEWHDFQETYMFFYPEKEDKTDRETDYWIDKPIAEDHIHDDEYSYALMRTNPKISGNIKMVIDSNGDLFMDTIEANDELSNAKYKKNKISPSGNFAVDVNRIFSKLSPEIMYDLKQKDELYLNSKNVYEEQYDFFYGYGAEQLPSKYYDENYKLFAPIWLRKKLPDFFVIFKTPGPINKESYFSSDREKLLTELLQNSKVLKTFDMRPGSNIGTYLRKIVDDQRFKEQPLKISYEKDELSTWSGVSYVDGILCEKGEFLYDFFQTDRAINDFEEIVTGGFQRNRMISTNLFNLEFLFDDNETSDYEINRYFGMYINEIELAQFEIFGDAFKRIVGQSPIPKKDVDAEAYSTKEFIQNNNTGIILPIDYYQGTAGIGQDPEKAGFVQGKLPLEESVQDPLRFFYIRDREDNIDRIKSIKEYEYLTPASTDYLKYTGIQLYDTSANISNYAGITRMTAQIPSRLLDKGKAQLAVDIVKTTDEQVFESLEVFEIEWVDINQDKQLWKMIANPTGLQTGDAWDFPVYNPDEFVFTNTFSPEGTAEDVAKALTTCINSFDNRAFTAYREGTRIYLQSELAGSVGNGFVFRRKMINNSIIENIKFYDIASNFSTDYEISSSSVTGSGTILNFAETPQQETLNTYNIKVTNVTKQYQLILDLTGAFIGTEDFTLNGVNFNTWLAYVDIASTLTAIKTELDSTLIPDYAFSAISGNQLIITFLAPITFSENLDPGNVYSFDPAVSPVSTYFSYAVQLEIRKNGGLIDTRSLIIDSAAGSGITPNPIYSYEGIQFELEPNETYVINDEWELESTSIDIEQRFIGGNDRNRQRTSILTTDALNLNPDHWFQTQKDKYSRLKKWDVQGQSVFKLPNLEDPTFDNKSQLNGYIDLDERKIIQIADVNYEFYQTLENRIVGFDAFEPTLGLMSFLPVKDFDFDWLVSDYSYVPNAELDRYYATIEIEQNESVELELNQSYIVTAGTVRLQGWDSTTEEWNDINISADSQNWIGSVEFDSVTRNIFNTFLPNYAYQDRKNESLKKDVSGNNYFYRNYVILSQLANITKLRIVGSDVENTIQKYAYNQDADLAGFNGFLGLSDFFSTDDEAELEKLIDQGSIDRFFFEQLVSEYDRLRENFNKDYAVKSRVVPYINKWTQIGTDCRDNKYRLNNSFAFGLTNFSPDTEIKERNPRLHTHEFYYLDEYPSYFEEDFLASSRSYFFQNISTPVYDGKSWYELFQQNDNDWFSKYFTIGYPSELSASGNKVPKKTEERYIFTDFVPGDESVQGIFRGGKFKILDIDPITNEIIQSSSKYEGYKFSSILRIQNLAFDLTEPPAEYEFFANDQYKTIVLVITLYINDYRIQDGGYGYSFLYTAKDALRATDIQRGDSFIALNSGYDSTNDYVEESFLDCYEAERHFEGFIGGQIIKYADVKLNGIFDTALLPSLDPRRLDALNVTDKEFVPSQEIFPIGSDYTIGGIFENRTINDLENGEYSEFSQYFANYPTGAPENWIVNNQPGPDQIIQINSGNIILGNGTSLEQTYSTRGNDSILGKPSRKRYLSGPSTVDETFNFASNWYLTGGKDYLERRLEEISFADIFTKVNNEDSSVKYYSVEDSGRIEGNYKFRFIDFDRIEKGNRLLLEEDIDKPEVYKNFETIGFNIVDTNESENVYRHRGRFEPKTYRVLNYWLREDETMTKHYGTDYLLSNTRWGIEYSNFGFINNLFFSKISDTQLMKISSSSSYESKYRLVNEIAIDTKDQYLFNSNWDDKYYQKYDDIAAFNSQQGTLELKEQKSFFGSKVMLVPKIFEFHEFNDNELAYEISKPLKSTDINSLSTDSQVLESSKKSKVIVTIKADDRIIREMLESGADTEFRKLKIEGYTRFASLSDDEITEEARKYLLANILKLYKVTEVVAWIKSDADEEQDQIVRTDLSEAAKRDLNYILSKNAKVTQTSDFGYQIELEIDTKKYRSFSFSITLERI